jgi:hypothetical protein
MGTLPENNENFYWQDYPLRTRKNLPMVPLSLHVSSWEPTYIFGTNELRDRRDAQSPTRISNPSVVSMGSFLGLVLRRVRLSKKNDQSVTFRYREQATIALQSSVIDFSSLDHIYAICAS